MVDGAVEDRELTAEEREAVYAFVRDTNLTSCDFVGDSGCCDPDCWRCHSPLRPENLQMLAKNLATVAMLCFAWQLREACPAWTPGCEETPAGLPSYMKDAIASPHIGAFLRGRR